MSGFEEKNKFSQAVVEMENLSGKTSPIPS